MKRLFAWLPQFTHQVWILAGGRLLSQFGTGFTLFYAPIFFVNQVGLSATQVGLTIGSASVSGILGRFIGGTLCDRPSWGRRKTMLLSALVSALADLVLIFTQNFITLLWGNLLMGLGIGLYWPATEAAVGDLTTAEQRNEAYAMTRLADCLGLGLGVILGGFIVATATNYRWLFAIDGVSFLLFFGVIYGAIAETYDFSGPAISTQQGWLIAMRDRRLWIFASVNILITCYLAQIQSTLPLYFQNFAPAQGLTAVEFSGVFSWYVICTAWLQLPLTRRLQPFSQIQVLRFSLGGWAVGFLLIWLTGQLTQALVIGACLSVTVLAIATVCYLPAASALIMELAPSSLRGIYFSLNSQCWAIGYLLGPPLGGWALDQGVTAAGNFWLGLLMSVVVGLLILQTLQRAMAKG